MINWFVVLLFSWILVLFCWVLVFFRRSYLWWIFWLRWIDHQQTFGSQWWQIAITWLFNLLLNILRVITNFWQRLSNKCPIWQWHMRIHIFLLLLFDTTSWLRNETLIKMISLAFSRQWFIIELHVIFSI